MPVTPPELLRFAKSIACDSEAACRAAISRAYYCAYHAAAPIAFHLPKSKDYDLTGHLRHSEVKSRLAAWRIPPAWSDAAKKSGDIHTVKRAYKAALVARATADYQLDAPITQDDVRLQIERVEPILQFCVRFAAATLKKASDPEASPVSSESGR